MLRTRLVAGATSGFVLSAIFATVLTIARFGDAFVEASRVRPGVPAPVTLRMPRMSMWAYSPRTGQMTLDTLTVTVLRGSVIQEEPLATLVRHHEAERRPPRTGQLAAQWLAYFLLIVTAATYMRRAGSDRAGLLRAQVSLFSLSLLMLVGSKLVLLLTDVPPYVLPVAAVPLWAALFIGRRTGLMLGAVLALCAASLLTYDPVVAAVYLVSTTVATFSFRSRKRGSLVLLSGALAGVMSAIIYVAAQEIHSGLDLAHEVEQQLYSGPVSALIGGVLSGVIAYGFHAPVARLLGIVSRSELLYLSDLEQPLLQRMAERAPGSWEHSRMMANLAEAAAAAIGADALLTRVGAYYHDLGKSVQPKYFVENLRRGEPSPHEHLAPEVSADAIMAHVVEGVRILREGGIPEAVVEFAYTHHGTSVIEFFWHKCKKEGNPRGLNENAFRYPGMRPRTKETGILMLVDAIEAGARTVDPPQRKKFGELVRRVIFTKLQQGQLDESGLTPAELRTVTNRIIDTLCSAYHSRIRYPWQEQQDAERQAETTRGEGNAQRPPTQEVVQGAAADRETQAAPPSPATPTGSTAVALPATSPVRAPGEVPQESQAFSLPVDEPTQPSSDDVPPVTSAAGTAFAPTPTLVGLPPVSTADSRPQPQAAQDPVAPATAVVGSPTQAPASPDLESDGSDLDDSSAHLDPGPEVASTDAGPDQASDPAATGRFERNRDRKTTGTERACAPSAEPPRPVRRSQG